ncbi:hypothetical protein U0C82_16095 [Fulvimarina sp. 2208YS6-2-32]|uniref:Uncharacterized protein n=1 Tax=Fulvimarina uroteuthidis TaxID=3098149 RepID=A0ABU5I6B9_9HYPH|nr:hypothetical protein [Fulvimarina sp. 2208YS6-2-32]MDY8110665.1 hypothetical protein [Fulvimarina sp. 2208YS6-2-32]
MFDTGGNARKAAHKWACEQCGNWHEAMTKTEDARHWVRDCPTAVCDYIQGQLENHLHSIRGQEKNRLWRAVYESEAQQWVDTFKGNLVSECRAVWQPGG